MKEVGVYIRTILEGEYRLLVGGEKVIHLYSKVVSVHYNYSSLA